MPLSHRHRVSASPGQEGWSWSHPPPKKLAGWLQRISFMESERWAALRGAAQARGVVMHQA